MNSKQAAAKRKGMAEKAKDMMDLLFPSLNEDWLWSRKRNDGFTTIPRTLPIIMQAIDEASKTQPAGHVLFCLWARSPDHPLVTIENPAIFAAEAGFSGLRMVDTWRRRMKSLVELRFIMAKPGASGDFHYVLLLNPNMAMENLHLSGRAQEDLYIRFVERLTAVGASGELETFRKLFPTPAVGAPPSLVQ